MFTVTNRKIRRLLALDNEIFDLQAAKSVLEWDQETYMPEKGIEERAHAIAAIEAAYHQRLTRKSVGKLIESLEDEVQGRDFSIYDRALIRTMRREYDRAVKQPKKFVKELAEHCSRALETWKKAKKENNFPLFVTDLEKMIELKRQQAKYLGYVRYPYDALLDEYEPGMTQDKLQNIFPVLRRITLGVLEKIRQSDVKPQTDFLKLHYPKDRQLEFSRKVLESTGFDFSAGRVDLSTHPFTVSFHPKDVRMTLRVNEDYLPTCIIPNLHEGGHSLYEQGIDVGLARTRLANVNSLGLHESQSRLWENCIGKSFAFWRFWYPKLQKYFPENLNSVSLENFVLGINKVEPSPIRTEADEATYNLHINLRYDIESELINGDLEAKEVPEVWNSKMQQYLEITPDTDTNGCLQDIHWANGYWGYFPTYSLGNIYAAQISQKLIKDFPDLEERVAKGELVFIKDWLNQNIHRWGMTYRPDELMTMLTGSALDPSFFENYLENKFGRLYQF